MNLIKYFSNKVTMVFSSILFSLVFFWGCNKTETSQPISSSRTMIINALASTASTPVNCFLDSQRVTLTSLAYGGATNYLVVLNKYSNVGFLNATTGASIASSKVELIQNKNYSIFLYGTTVSPLTLITTDDLTAPPDGKAKIRVVNLCQNIPVNIDLAIRNDYQIPASSVVLSANNAYGSASSFVPVDTCSNYSLILYNKGTTTTIASSSKINILPNLNYTILVRGTLGGTPAIAIQTPINNVVY